DLLPFVLAPAEHGEEGVAAKLPSLEHDLVDSVAVDVQVVEVPTVSRGSERPVDAVREGRVIAPRRILVGDDDEMGGTRRDRRRMRGVRVDERGDDRRRGAGSG